MSVVVVDELFIDGLIAGFDAEFEMHRLVERHTPHPEGDTTVVVESPYHQISMLISDFYFKNNLSTFLTFKNVSEIVPVIFTNEVLRDFVLNFTDRATVLLSANDIDIRAQIDKTITALKRNRSSIESLTPEPIALAIDFEPETLCDMLDNSRWLFYLYIVLVYFHRTSFYEQLKALS